MAVLNVIDLGNGDYKLASNEFEGVKTYPAVSGQLSGKASYQMADKENELDAMSILVDGTEYAFGNNAIKNCKIRNHDTTESKYTSEETMLLSHAALSIMAKTTVSNVNLIIALPIHKMDEAASVIQKYKGRKFGGHLGRFGKIDSIAKSVVVDKVIAIEQPWGTLFKTILDGDGKLNKDLATKGIAVYDIGFKTNDGIVFKDLDVIGRLTINSKNGMFVAFQQIQDRISGRFDGLEVKLFEVPDIIKKGSIQGKSIVDIIEDAFLALAHNIALEINSKWADAWEIEQIIFTGGGAGLLKPYLIQAFKDAQFEGAHANADGLLRYAKRIWGDQL